MPTRHMEYAIIQDTIETELPSLWNNAIGNVLIGRCSSSGVIHELSSRPQRFLSPDATSLRPSVPTN